MFYILSLKWTTGESCSWWGPDNSGYTSFLERAGKYTLEQIKAEPRYYNDGEVALAVPCEVADGRAMRTVRADVGSIVTAARELHSAFGLLK